MKVYNKILPYAVLSALILSACDDDKMDWHTPEGHNPITSVDEIPLSSDETINNYKSIKDYMAENLPGVPIGIGLTADLYVNDETYRNVVNDNFQQFVCGNAMKYGVVCKGSGTLDFSAIDAFFDAVGDKAEVYGHNLIWHTQQPQDYLLNLIQSEQIIHRDNNESFVNYIKGGSFKDGMDDWTHANGKDIAQCEIVDDDSSPDGDGKVLKVDISSVSTNLWDIQLQSKFIGLKEGNEYKVTYYAKTDGGTGEIRFSTNTSYDGEKSWEKCHYQGNLVLTSSWKEYTYSWVANGTETTLNIDLGNGGEGVFYFDNITVIDPNEEPTKINYIEDGTFSNATEEKVLGSWSQNWGDERATAKISDVDDSFDGDGKVLEVDNKEVSASDQWKTQLQTKFIGLEEGKTYVVSFAARSVSGSGTIRFSTNTSYNGDESWKKCHYQGDISITSSWKEYSYEWEANGTETTLNIDCAAFDGVLQVDAVTVYEKEATSKKAHSKATTITYVPKTPEEKEQVLLDAMKTWITDMITHCKTKGNVTQWDVLNEPIGDDNKIRGVDGGFMSGDGIPEESETDELKLNWVNETGNKHFYWGYYLGKGYAVKAFEYAREADPDAKLYVNEYNLETSDGKLEALIDYVKYIDQEHGSPIVDGIGTQMHIMCFNTDDTKNDAAKEGIKNMFKKLVATGKLVRVSELDVAFSYTHEEAVSPTNEQLLAQAETYKYIIEQYKELVPDAQKGGFTVWTLTDSDAEHEYWLKGDKPNLFTAKYERKPAYKGLCDGIAGRDLSEDFSGSAWSNVVEDSEE